MARSLQTHPNNTDTHPRRPARRDANSCPAGGSFQGGNKRHQQSKGRGGKVETRVACWPDQAAGQRMHHRSRIQVAASRSATPFGSSGSALGGSSQLERRNNTFPAVHLCRSFRKALPPPASLVSARCQLQEDHLSSLSSVSCRSAAFGQTERTEGSEDEPRPSHGELFSSHFTHQGS